MDHTVDFKMFNFNLVWNWMVSSVSIGCNEWSFKTVISSLAQPRLYFTGSPSVTPSQSSPESCSSWSEGTDSPSVCGGQSISPNFTYEPEPHVLAMSGPGSSLDPPQGPSRLAVNSLINSPGSIFLSSSVELRLSMGSF